MRTVKTDQTGQMPWLIFRWAHMPYCRFCRALALMIMKMIRKWFDQTGQLYQLKYEH